MNTFEKCERIEELIIEIKKALKRCGEYNDAYQEKKKRTDLKYKIIFLFKFCDVKLTDYDKEIFNIWHDISFNALIEQTDDMVTHAIDNLEYYKRDFETLSPCEEEDK